MPSVDWRRAVVGGDQAQAGAKTWLTTRKAKAAEVALAQWLEMVLQGGASLGLNPGHDIRWKEK